jgi:hypothetical protein
MKKIPSLLFFFLGFSTITLAQQTESQNRSLEDLKNAKIQLQTPLELPKLNFADTLRFDPPITFSPENPFSNQNIITFQATPTPVYTGRVLELPDPNSRMPLMAFPEKNKYTILIKEYK